jgi:hypothetical protein
MRGLVFLFAILASALFVSQPVLAEGGGPPNGYISPEIRAAAAQKAANCLSLPATRKSGLSAHWNAWEGMPP